MKIIGTKDNDLKFILHTSFQSKLFSPIGRFINWKLENNWDDYNELYHAINYIEGIKRIEGIWYEIHIIEKMKKL